MRVIITIDDGDRLDRFVAKLLDKYDLNGTFFVPGTCKMSVGWLKEISKNHEIGAHTENHKLLTQLKKEDQIREVTNNIKHLQELTGQKITKLAYPKGWYNDDVVKNMKGLVDEAFTMKLGCVYSPKEKLAMPRTFHLRPRGEYKKLGIVGSAIELFEKSKVGGYFNLCLHSWEVAKYNTWDELKAILKHIHENKDSITKQG